MPIKKYCYPKAYSCDVSGICMFYPDFGIYFTLLNNP